MVPFDMYCFIITRILVYVLWKYKLIKLWKLNNYIVKCVGIIILQFSSEIL